MKTVFVNGTVLDGTREMQPRTGLAVVVEGEKILSIEPGEQSYPGCRVVDLEGGYIMPGLINMHVHMAGDGRPRQLSPKSTARKLRLLRSSFGQKLIFRAIKGYAKTELMSGTTTLRTVGGVGTMDTDLRREIDSGRAVGPRILASDLSVTVENGHGAGTLGLIAHTPEEAAAFVRQIGRANPDVIKLMITGGVMDAKVKGEPGILRMQPELVRAACDEAHRLGYKVAAHVESPEGVRVALENGVDTIEHGAKPDDEIIALFKSRGAAHICTISPALPLAVFDPEENGVNDIVAFNAKVVFDGIIDCAKRCLQEGIPVGLGTDTSCPNVTHYDFWRELCYFVKYCGVTPAFALYSATLGNAKIAGIDGVTGSIEAGKCADMVVTREMPLDNSAALRFFFNDTATTEIYTSPRVKKFPEVEAALDRVL